MDRFYQKLITEHFDKNYNQAVFLTGPRQVGKTTVSKNVAKLYQSQYLNWDIESDRLQILDGQENIARIMRLDQIAAQKKLLIIDEIQKFKDWKNYIKGLIDQYSQQLKLIITGSSKLNVFRKGQDSLMGRYFLYNIHPLSIAEITNKTKKIEIYSYPSKISTELLDQLFDFGGFPEPFLRNDQRFYNIWQNTRKQQLFREDVQELENIKDIGSFETLAAMLTQYAGKQFRYADLAKKIRVADTTIRRWVDILELCYYCFTIKPWSNNVARSLIKEPKIYLYDWSLINDRGAKIENFVACHLLKWVHFLSDSGFGAYDLFYIRDKEQREVDFLITKDNKPWILLEVKASKSEPINKNIAYFRESLKTEYAFQLAFDMDYIDVDLFNIKEEKIVPLVTFLSQLV